MTKQYLQIDFGAGFLHAEYLSNHFDSFACELEKMGYARLTIRGYAGSIVHFGHWAQQNKLALQGWNYDTVANFSRHQCRCPGGRRRENISIKYSRRVQRFIDYLGRHKIISTVAHARQPKPSEFHDWLVQHRGVCAQTIERYELALAKLLPPGGVEAYMLTAQWVRALVLDKAQCQSLPQTSKMVLAFRAYLKFLASQGRCQPGLDQAIPRIPQWRLAALPQYLPPEDVERVIASCRSDTPLGLRDRAILLLLARLGLRGGDIVRMRLDDIDWPAATLRVCGKGRQEVCLPLPQDAGDAILAYLQHGRCQISLEQVFLCVQAPYRPLQSSGVVSNVVSAALSRAEVVNPPSRGANLLRHSAATAMLRGGASLDAVSSMLRHRSLDMTGYYAKVDIGMLELVVQPWPEAMSC